MKARYKALSKLELSLLVFLNLLVIGLIDSNRLSSAQTKIEKDAFPVVIDNGSNPKSPDGRIWTISFKEDLIIGVKEGDENYMFGDRIEFNVDNEGNIYAVDWDRKRIQKYGPDGTYILTIGRDGQGPGEFINPWKPYFNRQGNLYIRDIANHKVSFFDLKGELITEIKLPEKVDGIQINSRGDYVGGITDIQVDPKSKKTTYSHSYGLFDQELNPIGVFLQTTWTSSLLKGRDPDSLAEFLAETMSKNAYSPEVTHILGRDDRIYLGYPESYEIKVYSPEGKPEKLIRKDQPLQPVTESYKKDFAASQEKDFLVYVADLYPESVRKKALSLIRYPKYLPAYQKFVLLDNGWLAVVVDVVKGGLTKLDFFDENGIYIAEILTRIPIKGLIIRKDKAYAIYESEDGYQFIKRYAFSALNSDTNN